ncbi:hypothetical protein ERJ75_001104500 [Trypanosoma vivax]|nr:hypothetical protein ERJ75_001104500 [Trypanosoma vivax]
MPADGGEPGCGKVRAAVEEAPATAPKATKPKSRRRPRPTDDVVAERPERIARVAPGASEENEGRQVPCGAASAKRAEEKNVAPAGVAASRHRRDTQGTRMATSEDGQKVERHRARACKGKNDTVQFTGAGEEAERACGGGPGGTTTAAHRFAEVASRISLKG